MQGITTKRLAPSLRETQFFSRVDGTQGSTLRQMLPNKH